MPNICFPMENCYYVCNGMPNIQVPTGETEYGSVTSGNLQISARNQIKGTVSNIKKGGVNAEVTIDIGCGNIIISTITISSLQELAISVGLQVTALIKAPDVSLGIDSGTTGMLTTSALNQLRGTVTNINQGSVDSEVTVNIGCRNTITAVITSTSLQELGIKEGSAVIALIRPANVGIAV